MEDVLIPNPEQLKKKIEQIKKDGVSHLHIVSDFDRTLTPAFIDGQKTTSVIAQIRAGKYLTPDYPAKSYALFDEYHPIEIADDIPQEVKNKKMYEWWSKHLQLIVKSGMNKQVIEDIIKKRKIVYRRGVKEFLGTLATHKIPMLIFSAALGDLIEDSLKFEKMFHSNIHVISDFFEFDSKGNAVGYKSDIVHVFNKNEGQIKNSPYYEKMNGRENVILLGDGLGDSSMLEGLKHKTIIKIGFLNENVEKQLTNFKKEYDVVLLGDGAFDYPNEILKRII